MYSMPDVDYGVANQLQISCNIIVNIRYAAHHAKLQGTEHYNVRAVHIGATLQSCLQSCALPKTLFFFTAGGRYVAFCAIIQYVNLVGTGIGYTVTAGVSMV